MKTKILLIISILLGINLFQSTAQQPSFIVTPTNIDFGTSAPGTTLSKTFTVKNTFSQAFLVSVPNWSASYITSVSPRNVTLNPGATQKFTVNVTFPNNTNQQSYLLILTYSNKNYSGDINPSPWINLKSVIPSPPAPANLSFNNVTTSGYTMSWSASSGATGYNIYLNGVKQTSVTSTNYIYTGLSAGTSYTVGVSAYNNNGESSKTTVNKPTICIAPPNVHATSIEARTIYLAWDAVYGAESYLTVWGSNTSSNSYPNNYIYGLNPSTTYVIDIYAQNASGLSAPTTITLTTASTLKRGTVSNSYKANELEVQDPKFKGEEIKIYPNPVSNNLNISGIENFDLTIYNDQGNKVMDFLDISQSVNVSHLKKGIYSVEIKYQGKTYNQKFIKE